MTRSGRFYSTLLLSLLLLKALLMIGFILYGPLGLGPDEAQYWTWSRALDWGYYSKPPAIAWQIALGTSWWGHSELGVRFMAVLISFLQAGAMFLLALKVGLSHRGAFWCGLMMAFSPIGILGSLFAITDGGFLLFWTLSCIILCAALYKNKTPNPWALGLCILAGALFKWPIYTFWIIFFISRRFYFRDQKISYALLGVGISLLGLLPSLWWNIHHDWATFRHVSATLQGGSSATPGQGNPFEFLGSQMALYSPILFVLLILSFYPFARSFSSINRGLQVAGWISLGGFAFFFGASLFQKIQGNWSVALLPTSLLLISWRSTQHDFKWIKIGVAFCLILLLGVLPFVEWIPYRLNPFKHNMGGLALQERLQEVGYDPKVHFLVSDKYQTTSLLSFYSEEQKRAYFLNLQDMRRNQFSYWPSLRGEQKGASGYFVWVENTPRFEKELDSKRAFYEEKLKKHFAQVTYKGNYPLIEQSGKVVKGALFFECIGPSDEPEVLSSKF